MSLRLGYHSPLRIALFGGSFNPVHLGHLFSAQDAQEQLMLDRVVFLPAKVSPDKLDQESPIAAEHRLKMLELAIASHRDQGFEIDTTDLLGESCSYAVTHAERWVKQYPNAVIFYLIGSDKLPGLSSWQEWKKLTNLVQIAVFRRPETEAHYAWGPKQSKQVIASHGKRFPVIGRLMEFSSTEIRERLAEGRKIDYFVPQSVADYLQQHHLYSCDSNSSQS